MIRCASALFVVSLGYGVIVPQMPQLLGSDDAGLLSVLFVGYAAAKLAFQIPGGALADRLGAARVVRWALVGFCLSLVPFAFAVPAWALVVARAVEGACTGLIYPAVLSLAAALPGDRRGTNLGVIAGIGTGGFLLGPAVAALLAPTWGPRVPVGVALALALAVTVAFGASRAEAGPVVAPRALRAELDQLRAHLGSAAFVARTLPVAQNKLAYTALQALLPLHGAAVLGLGSRGITLLFVLTAVGFGLGQPLGGLVGDRVPPLRAIAVLSFVVPSALVALAAVTTPVGFVPIFAVWLLAASMIFALSIQQLAADVGGTRGAGLSFGVFQTLSDLATIVGPPMFLAIRAALERHGAGGQVFAAMAAVCAALLVAGAIGSRRPLPPALRAA